MAYSRLGQENPRLSSSPVAEEELFEQIFDWRRYCESTTTTHDLEPSHLLGCQSPRNLSKLLPHLAPTTFQLESLAIHDLQTEFGRMRAPFRSSDDDSAATSSDYSGQSPPGLSQEGGSSSPSDHSGSVFLDHAEERTHSTDVTLQEVQAQDDEWTYPRTDLAKAARRGYPTHIFVQGEYPGPEARPAAGIKRRRSLKDTERRPRQLVDPVQTADVRKSGACVPCRVTKTRVRHCHAYPQTKSRSLSTDHRFVYSVLTMVYVPHVGRPSRTTLIWSVLACRPQWPGQSWPRSQVCRSFPIERLVTCFADVLLSPPRLLV